LVILGEKVDVAGVWLTGVEYCIPESTRYKVMCVKPKGVDAAERSQHGGLESMRRKVIGVAGGCRISWTEADVADGIQLATLKTVEG
jgi:hypothetical protein